MIHWLHWVFLLLMIVSYPETFLLLWVRSYCRNISLAQQFNKNFLKKCRFNYLPTSIYFSKWRTPQRPPFYKEYSQQNSRALTTLKCQSCKVFCMRQKIFGILTKGFRKHTLFSVKYKEFIAFSTVQSLLAWSNSIKIVIRSLTGLLTCLWKEAKKFCLSAKPSFALS